MLSSNDMVMPVSPMNNFGGFGGMGGEGWWLIIILLFALSGNGFGGMGNNGVFPWLMASGANTNNDVQRGFDQSAILSSISDVQSSINASEVSECNRAMNQMQTAYQNQIATMNQNFATAQAIDSRLDTIASNQQQCCCENRAQTADLKYTVATEAAANRAASLANTQAIMDKLCQLEIDGVRNQLATAERENAALQNQLAMANLAASQTAQTAALIQDNTAQTQTLIQRIAPYPTPSYIVGNPYSGYNFGCGNVVA